MKFEEIKYRSRTWRTDMLLEAAAHDVHVRLQALLPQDYKIAIKYEEREVPGFPFAPKDKVTVQLVPTEDGADSPHFFVQARTVEGAHAKMLAVLFDGPPIYPLK